MKAGNAKQLTSARRSVAEREGNMTTSRAEARVVVDHRPATKLAGLVTGRLRSVVALRFSGVYGLVGMIIIFSIASPVFWSHPTALTILNSTAIDGILALGVMVPFAARVIDLQFGNVLGLSIVLTTWFSVNSGLNDWIIALLVLTICAVLGAVSGCIVAFMDAGAVVVTLAVGTVALGIGWLVLGSNTESAEFNTSSFAYVGEGSWLSLPIVVWLMIALAVISYVWFERTASGRYVRIVGDNKRAALLSGIRVRLVLVCVLIYSSLIAGVGGLLFTAQTQFGSNGLGANYLFPVVGAIVLGSTQIKGRINVLGTILAVYLIATGTEGVNLLQQGDATWTANFLAGTLLLLGIGFRTLDERRQPRRAGR